MTGAQVKGCVNTAVNKKVMGQVSTAAELWASFDNLQKRVEDKDWKFTVEDF